MTRDCYALYVIWVKLVNQLDGLLKGGLPESDPRVIDLYEQTTQAEQDWRDCLAEERQSNGHE